MSTEPNDWNGAEDCASLVCYETFWFAVFLVYKIQNVRICVLKKQHKTNTKIQKKKYTTNNPHNRSRVWNDASCTASLYELFLFLFFVASKGKTQPQTQAQTNT